MPTVLRINGFRVLIRPPPREHGPPHVHVTRAGAIVLVNLNTPEVGVSVRKVVGMSARDVRRAVAIVAAHADMLRNVWRQYHGNDSE